MSKNRTNNQAENSGKKTGELHQETEGAADWLWQFSVELSENRPLKIFMLILLVVSLFSYYPTRGDDYDVWWHLALGKHYVQNHTMTVDHSIFSWTPADKDWIYNTWLGSTLLYLAYSAMGGFGLWVVQFSVMLLLFLLFVAFIKLIGDTVDINYFLGFLLVGLALNLTAIYVKPELFSTLFFAVTVFIYFYGKFFERKQAFYVYPFLFVLWVNVHGGFLAGLMFLSVAFAGEALNSFVIKRTPMKKELIVSFFIVLVLSYLGTLLNPYGISYHISVLQSLFASAYMGFAKQVFAYKSMWAFVFPKEMMYRFIVTAWCLLLFAFAAIGLSVYAYRKKKYVDPALILINVYFFFFSMNAARYTIFFPIIILYTFAYIIKKTDSVQLKARTTIASCIILFILAGYADYTTIFYQDSKTWFGQKIDDSLPVKEVDYILKNKIEGPLFNDYLIGGYMMWKMYPKYKVFIDPRYGPFWKEVGPDYFNFMSGVSPDKLKLFNQKYPFKAALLHMRESDLIFFMINTGDWRLAYFDKVAVVLIHKSLIPTLSKEALSTDVSPARFKDVDSPSILGTLFNFYVAIGPQFGQQIHDIYKKNVSDLYWFKEQAVTDMESRIAQREQQVRQQRAQQMQQAQQQQQQQVIGHR